MKCSCVWEALYLFLKNTFNIELGIEYYYWIYSTLTQSLAALIAIVGVFSVFRLQMKGKDLERSINALEKYLIEISEKRGIALLGFDEKNLLKSANQFIERNSSEIKGFSEEMTNAEEELKNIKPPDQTPLEKNRLKSIIDTKKRKIKNNQDQQTHLSLKKREVLEQRLFFNFIAEKALSLTRLLILTFLSITFFLMTTKFLEHHSSFGISSILITFILLSVGIVFLYKFCQISLKFNLTKAELEKLTKIRIEYFENKYLN